MLRRIALLGSLLVALTGAAAMYTCSRGTVVPGTTPRPLAELIDAPLATDDSVQVANFMHQRCRLLTGRTKRSCYEDVLMAMVTRHRTHLAMASLAELSRLDPSIDARGHDFVHVVGINSWQPGMDVGAVYNTCTGLFQSGCFHGVIQAYMSANGADSTVITGLCEKIQPPEGPSLWLRFQCVHGLGHGLQAITGHLRHALEGCDWLADSWDEESCYGGAFMEFILEGRGQEHHPHMDAMARGETPGAKDDSAGHAGMDHGDHQMAAADSFPFRDRSDPLYPCTALAERYQRSCYGMQAGIIYELLGPDFAKIAAACDQAPLAMRPACYQGIGTYTSGVTVRNTARSIEYCMMGNPEWRPWCFVGVVKNFVDVTADPQDGLDFCAQVSDRVIGTACYVAVGEEMVVLHTDLTKRGELCQQADERFRNACRFGGGISADRPADLPNFTPGG